MHRYFVELSYKGTKYCGWQIQLNASTVQARLQNAFSMVLNSSIELVGAGRTDTGVHAMKSVAHFDYCKLLTNKQIDSLLYKINSILPADIAIHRMYEVPLEAHARFSALWRTYQYYITSRKEVFMENQMTRYNKPLNISLMNEACSLILGTNDFTTFSKLHSDVKNNLCTVKHAQWVLYDYKYQNDNSSTLPPCNLQMYNTAPYYVFTVVANRFLRNMVRSLVGTLMDVGKEKLSVHEFQNIFENLDRSKASSSAPADGLYLMDIEYPEWTIQN